jgi:hypothetical protein
MKNFIRLNAIIAASFLAIAVLVPVKATAVGVG